MIQSLKFRQTIHQEIEWSNDTDKTKQSNKQDPEIGNRRPSDLTQRHRKWTPNLNAAFMRVVPAEPVGNSELDRFLGCFGNEDRIIVVIGFQLVLGWKEQANSNRRLIQKCSVSWNGWLTLHSFQRWMKWRATSRALCPIVTKPWSRQGIRATTVRSNWSDKKEKSHKAPCHRWGRVS